MSKLVISWCEILGSEREWDNKVQTMNQSLFNYSGILELHRYGSGQLRGVLVTMGDEVMGLLSGICNYNDGNFTFEALSFPSIPMPERSVVLEGLLTWLKDQGCIKYSQGSYEGGLENIDELPSEATKKERLEFIYDLSLDEESRRKLMNKNHSRKLKKMQSMNLAVKEVRSQPAWTMAKLRNNWSRRKGFSVSLFGFMKSYIYYKKLNKYVTNRGLGKLYGVYDKDGEILSMAYMFEDNKSAFYMEGASSHLGYKIGASVQLFWDLFRKYSSDGIKYVNLGGVPLEAERDGHDEHGVYQFKRAFGIEPVVRLSAVFGESK